MCIQVAHCCAQTCSAGCCFRGLLACAAWTLALGAFEGQMVIFMLGTCVGLPSSAASHRCAHLSLILQPPANAQARRLEHAHLTYAPMIPASATYFCGKQISPTRTIAYTNIHRQIYFTTATVLITLT